MFVGLLIYINFIKYVSSLKLTCSLVITVENVNEKDVILVLFRYAIDVIQKSQSTRTEFETKT